MTELQQAQHNYESKCKQAKDLLRWINNIATNLMEGELTLADIQAEEESLNNRNYELEELLKEIISARLWLDFLNSRDF